VKVNKSDTTRIHSVPQGKKIKDLKDVTEDKRQAAEAASTTQRLKPWACRSLVD